jgi:isopenicillin-N N-acyltransferase like protein
MDWYVIDAVNNVLFDLTCPDGTRVMGLAGAPYLLMLGMNSHGVGNVSNSVHSNDNRIGVPNAFVRRSTLEARTLEDARDRGLLAARARGTNQAFADTSGRLWDVETSALAHAFMDHTAAGFMGHTNHYVSAAMKPHEGASHEESVVRLATAERLLKEGIARGEDPVDLVARVLRCHDPSTDQAICGHPDESEPLADQGMTVGSMICDLDERRLYACAGPPCENAYQVFEL